MEGFRLNYTGPRMTTDCRNLVSVFGNEVEVAKKLLKEINLGRIAGPFNNIPLFNLRLSPIGLCPKKDGSWRLIQHLSYPHGLSVNDYIDKGLCSVTYTPFDHALDMVGSQGKFALIGKKDISSAFRLLPVNPDDFELLGFKFLDFYFVDRCLPQGCSLSCATFEKFSTFLECIFKDKTGSESVIHYLDDFLFAGPGTDSTCLNLMSEFDCLCDRLGVPLAHDKTVGPTHVLTFLGLEINTIEMSVKIPKEKLLKLKTIISNLLGKKRTTLRVLQSFTGILNFCSRVIPTGRAFNRRFYDAMSGISNPRHHIRLTASIKEDIRLWSLFLDCFNGKFYFPDSDWISNVDMELFTDSAGSAFGGCASYLHPNWAFFPWPSYWLGCDILKDITFLELLPIVLAFHLWYAIFANKKIILHVDNKALVHILNSKTSKSRRVMHILRPLVLKAMVYNIQFKAMHITSNKNCIADAISRQQWPRFRRMSPEALQEPEKVPQSFLQVISNLNPTSC